jgi:hypothetical protein
MPSQRFMSFDDSSLTDVGPEGKGEDPRKSMEIPMHKNTPPRHFMLGLNFISGSRRLDFMNGSLWLLR